MDTIVDTWRWRIVKQYGTLKKFCEDNNVSQQVLSAWVNGKKHPSDKSIDRIEKLIKKGE